MSSSAPPRPSRPTRGRAPDAAVPKSDILWSVTAECILFEDEDLIAINKPAGLPSQATLDPGRNNLHRSVETYLKSQGGEGYAGLHQRLDRETSGVLVLTKSRRANKGLADQISGHRVVKIYNAITAAPLKEHPLEWSVRNHLRKQDGRKDKTRAMRMEATLSGGDLAETEFRCLRQGKKAWFVEARPHTGRMHQIRVHLADSGLPILGDPLYAARGLVRRAPRCLLHARELHLTHPITGEALRFEAPLPKDFEEALNQL